MTTHLDERAVRQQLGAYQSQTVETASPARLISLLFEGALRSIDSSRSAIESQDIEQSHEHLLKAQAIVTELSASLNTEDGGELATRLASLYDYCTGLLVEANVKKDIRPLTPAAEILSSLRDSWDEMTREHFAD